MAFRHILCKIVARPVMDYPLTLSFLAPYIAINIAILKVNGLSMNRTSAALSEAMKPQRSAPKLSQLLAAISICVSSHAIASAESPDFKTLAAQCAPGVHVVTLSAIVRHESRANPYAIGLNASGARLPRQPRNKAEAVATAHWLNQRGYNFDGGYGQVNVKNLGWLGMTIDDLFDPCKNLKGAAQVLTDCYRRASSLYGEGQTGLHRALSCYNTGNFRDGLANGYVLKVAANATLDVPALMPPQGAEQPLKLEAVQHIKPASAPNSVKPLPDGVGDAFSQSQDDAFISGRKTAEKESSEEQEKK